MVNDRYVSMKGVVAVPVGHRVEVTVTAHEALSGGMEPAIWNPRLRDLETGVIYGDSWDFTNKDCTVDQLPFEVRRDLVIAERFVGRVRACRILSGKLPDMGTVGWITNLWLSIEP